MKFSELFQLITESVKVEVAEYINQLKYAYIMIFDLESEDVIDQSGRETSPPSSMHCHYRAKIEILYRGNHYKIFHHLSHYKDSNSTNHEPIVSDMLKKSHPLIKTRIQVFEVSQEKDQFDLNSENLLGDETLSGGIDVVVQRVKRIIDDSDGNSNEETPEPISPRKTLMPV